MSAEAQAWSEAALEADRRHVGDSRRNLPLRRAARPRAGALQSERAGSWNVLAEELVSFPRPGRHATLEDLTGVRLPGGPPRDDSADIASARRYGEAWLERELLSVRYLADSGYPAGGRRAAAPRRPRARPTAWAGVTAGRYVTEGATALALPPREEEDSPLERGPRRVRRVPGALDAGSAGDTAVAARPRTRAAVKPRGLRRLLPGVATLAVLTGVWAGAGVLSASHARPLAVLPGSVKTSGGYMYVVRPGDTLWSIAVRLDPGGDPRALVAQLETQVHGGTLQPGSRLRLP